MIGGDPAPPSGAIISETASGLSAPYAFGFETRTEEMVQ